ncbi:MAG: hypothetical protein WBQ59_07350, partial [Candidatus Acidiferrum sp.]
MTRSHVAQALLPALLGHSSLVAPASSRLFSVPGCPTLSAFRDGRVLGFPSPSTKNIPRPCGTGTPACI